MIVPRELTQLDMPDDREVHASHLGAGVRFMEQMIPPFESFYEAHRDEVFRFLARRLGRERAEDAFQETFLRALRAYPRLEHGEHLRAWVFTIASRIVVDDARQRRPQAELVEPAAAED